MSKEILTREEFEAGVADYQCGDDKFCATIEALAEALRDATKLTDYYQKRSVKIRAARQAGWLDD